MTLLNLFILFSYLSYYSIQVLANELQLVRTQSGLLRGKLVKEKDATFYSFQGIPYAEPPLGELRFKSPRPIKPWVNILDATREGPVCPQDRQLNSSQMSEDCLFLNVYTPSTKKQLLPVMFWIHGGEFNAGSGNSDVFGPQLILQENVIVVTTNYRLGALGFLCLMTEDNPGNAGLKDVVASLRWVNNNIASFGGDPSQVTIAGESAGSVVVHYLLMTKMTDGLVGKAILSSGSAIGYRFLSNSSVEDAFELTKTLGKDIIDKKEALDYLRSKSPREIIHAINIIGTTKKKGATVFTPFVPCVERKFDNEEIFLSDYPLSLITSNAIKKVPIIAGFNTDEGLKLFPILTDEVLAEINDDFQRVVPSDLGLQEDSEAKIAIGEEIKQFYFGNQSLKRETLPEYIKVIGDAMFIHSIDYWLRIRSSNEDSLATYYYEFDFDGAFNYAKLVREIKYPGCAHGDDLGYLWLSDETKNIQLSKNNQSVIVRSRFVKMWTNFVKTGNPIPYLTKLLDVEWFPTSATQMNYMKITADLENRKSPSRNRTLFWENLYDY